MAALVLELTTTPGTIAGDVNYYEQAGGGDYDYQPFPVVPAPPANQNPAQIHDDQPWEVRLEGLSQAGAVFGGWGGNTWFFKVIFEEIGPGEAVPGFKEINFPVNTTVPFTYADQIIPFVAGELPEGEYKVYATLKMRDANNLTPVAGAGSLSIPGGVLQIVNA